MTEAAKTGLEKANEARKAKAAERAAAKAVAEAVKAEGGDITEAEAEALAANGVKVRPPIAEIAIPVHAPGNYIGPGGSEIRPPRDSLYEDQVPPHAPAPAATADEGGKLPDFRLEVK